MDKIKAILRVLLKPIRDLVSILYDDLEFQVMSLPRVGASALTCVIIWLVYIWAKTGRECPYFTQLCGLDGALWGTYLFKRRGNPPETTYRKEDIHAGNDKNENQSVTGESG